MRLDELLKHRHYWMAFAILWIVVYHSGFNFPKGINLIPALGYGGVDIFFLCSGVGAWYTVKRFGHHYVKYVTHSLKKILPLYYGIFAVWGGFVFWTDNITVAETFGNLTGLGWLIGMNHQFNWYMTAIICFYLVAPVLVRIAECVNTPTGQIAVLVILFLCGVPFFGRQILMMVSRLPIAYIGILLAKKSDGGGAISEKVFWILVMITLFLCMGIVLLMLFSNETLWEYGIWWYPMVVVAPTICFTISKGILLYGNRISLILKFAEKIGKMTFVIYLTHVSFFFVIKYLIAAKDIPNNNITWLFATLLLMLINYGVYGLQMLAKKYFTD